MNCQRFRRPGALFLLIFAAPTATLATEDAKSTPFHWQQWKADIAAFEKQDAEHPFAAGGIVFVGSSSIRMWDLAKWFPDMPVLNRGFGGSQICDSVHFAEALVVKHRPRTIVFYAGDNDIPAGKSAKQVQADFRAFVAAVRKSLPMTPIVFVSIKPSIDRWQHADAQRAANQLIKSDCDLDPTLEFVDVWPAMVGDDGAPRKELFLEDGLHMNDEGYKRWAELVRTHLRDEKSDRH